MSCRSVIFSALVVSAAFGCSSDSDASVPWAEQRTLVIDANRAPVEVEPVSGSACLTYEGECLKPNERCGEQGADVILDDEGHVLDYVCHPGEADLTVEEIEEQPGRRRTEPTTKKAKA